MTDLQGCVIRAAKEKLKYFKVESVCLDQLWEDFEIKENFDKAVDALVLDTLYWEDKDREFLNEVIHGKIPYSNTKISFVERLQERLQGIKKSLRFLSELCSHFTLRRQDRTIKEKANVELHH